MTEHANTELRKDEVHMLWVASQTRLPAAKARLILLRPSYSVKSCAKYQFPEEIGEQCRGRCGQKHGTAGFYVLHVTMNSTKFSLEVSIGAAYQRNDRLSS